MPTRMLLLAFALPLLACAAARPPSPNAATPAASRTHWVLEPSQAYDAIAFVNLLTGDPFYVDRGYRADYERYAARLGAREKQALAHLTRRLKVEAKQLIYPVLALAFSGADPVTLADLGRLAGDDAAWQRLRRTFAARSDTEADQLAALDDVRPDLVVLFAFLHDSGWDAMWTTSARPRVEAYIAHHAAIRDYDVVGADERVLGRRLDVAQLTAYVMAYGSPHGVRVQGWRFLTDVSYPPEVLVRTALHELLHPPFARTGELDRRLTALGDDPYFQRLVREHDPSYGYTTPAGLIEEDCATAVHIYNSERMGLVHDVPAYFRDHDDGIHVLSYVLYRRLVAHGGGDGDYAAFVTAAAREIAAAGGLGAVFAATPGRYDVAAWAKPAPR